MDRIDGQGEEMVRLNAESEPVTYRENGNKCSWFNVLADSVSEC